MMLVGIHLYMGLLVIFLNIVKVGLNVTKNGTTFFW